MKTNSRFLVEDLIGVWTLVSWVGEIENELPLGKNVSGQLIYSTTKEMSVVIVCEDRENISEGELFFGHGKERIDSFNSFLSYFGSYELEGHTVIHKIKGCSYPNWSGTTQRRSCSFISPNEMVLRAEGIHVNGKAKITYLTWRRISEQIQ